ncbi:MAG: hypothetical protein JRJ69_00935 [Deltaproteobacteria bacterium]|nr:hypothetical protein [Deltaproteobacteria bacterium]MBW1736131.1 hypothetical protein [Deltaproteobacteria bacterium]MBW1908459.1 hypothetical protein [Deltaproteobacteria bacterium]MBW2032510.1 hypothetical protein [Deltaproteobacteria bacterium]MBW2113437.1 hypothetical protein [Deltaproteobacteria bacterium]
MTISNRSFRSFALTVFKRLLDLGIVIYLVILLVVILTGGFKISLLGITIKANHLYTPINFLVPLIFIRMVITLKIKDCLLVIGSVVFSLCVTEVVIRIWDPPLAKPEMNQIHRASPALAWELIPKSSGIGKLGELYEVNSAGFRDVEHSLKKKQGVSRIMVIGDSFTFGMGVNLEDTYPKQLERFLNRANVTCEVINCGVIGYNMWQHYEMLERKVLPNNPDLVILGVFEDDIGVSVRPYKDPEDWKGVELYQPKFFSGVLNHLSLWTFIRNATALYEYKYRYRRGHNYMKGIEERKKVWGPSNPTDVNYRIMSGKIEKERYVEFSSKLKKFVQTANDAGVKVLVVFIPDSVQLGDFQMQAVNRFLKRVCGEIGVSFLDVTPFLESEDNYASLYLFPVDAHGTPKGLGLIAKSIADQIVRLGLLSFQSSG